MDEQKVKKLVFLDTVCDCSGDRDTLFIAMTPTVYSYLKRKGFRVNSTSAYFTSESHEKMLAKSDSIVKWIEENAIFLDMNTGTKDAFKNSLIFHMRFAVHYCLWVIEVVSNSVERHKPDVISAHSSAKRHTVDLFIQPEEGYLGRLIKMIAQHRKLGYENIPEAGCSYKNEFLLKLQSVINFILKYIDFNLWEAGLLKKQDRLDGNPIIFTTPAYQMDKLANQVESMLIAKPLYFLKGPVISNFRIPDFVISLLLRRYAGKVMEQKNMLETFIRKVRMSDDLFVCEGIAFSDIVAQKLRDNIMGYVMGEVIWSLKLNEFLDRIKPSLVISGGNRLDDIILVELCRKKDINTILVGHGSLVPPKNKYEEIEWLENERNFSRIPFTAYLLQTPLSEDYFKKIPAESKLIKTGPLIWGKPINRNDSGGLFKKIFVNKNPNMKVVLHAGTPKPSKSLRPYIYETTDEYIDALYDLAEAVNEIEDALLIIKFRPTNEISEDDIRTRVGFSDKVVLIVNESFSDVMGLSSLLVSFSSTAIEETLQNRIPVLQYGGGGRYQHIPAQEIGSDIPTMKSAVYHVRDKKLLSHAIKSILSLNIGGEKDAGLFAPYIYTEDKRVCLADLMREYSENKCG